MHTFRPISGNGPAQGAWLGGRRSYALQPARVRLNAVHWGASRVAAAYLGQMWEQYLAQVGDQPMTTAAREKSRFYNLWIYNNTSGSILAVILFHGMVNFTGELFDISEWANTISIVLWVIVAIGITVIWGPKTFARQPTHRAQA